MKPTSYAVRHAVVTDAPALAEIYNHALAERSATFETEPRSAEERRRWIESHGERHPILVADREGTVAGWTSISPYRSRSCYDGVGEFSVYIGRDFRGAGIGKRLLLALIDEARRLGYWKLVSRVFTFNHASRALCAACGFREVGVYEKHGQLDGRWLDCIIVERLIEEGPSEGRKSVTMERFAVISDIHGNTWALDAVLADVKRRGITEIFNLGDSVYGSLDPAGTVDRLIAAGVRSISGNQDRILKSKLPEVRSSRDYQFITSHLGEERLRYITSLPRTLVMGDIFACHGTPEADDVYLLETVTEDGFGLSDTGQVLLALQGVGQGLVLCGHSHLSRTVALPTGQLVVNPGSVGLPAFSDDLPYFHRAESGSPHARYAVITRAETGWSVEHVALSYPWRKAADMARRRGRADRARWIETGRA